MDYSEDKFREHLQQLVRANELDSDRPLSPDELKELALSMGLSETQWLALLKKADEQLEQARGHMRVRNYSEAIRCAEEATAINPYIPDGNAILAQSYLQLGLEQDHDEFLLRASQCARMELKNDPQDRTAMNVLSALEHKHSEGKFNFRLIKTVSIACAIVAVIFVVIYLIAGRTSRTETERIIEQHEAARAPSSAEVERAKQIYLQAVRRRNDHLRTLAPKFPPVNRELIRALDRYDYNNPSQSEGEVLLLSGKLRNSGKLTQADEVNLDGDANRISTEKMRWINAISAYNEAVERSGNGTPMSYPE